jgi:hypothetical protein
MKRPESEPARLKDQRFSLARNLRLASAILGNQEASDFTGIDKALTNKQIGLQIKSFFREMKQDGPMQAHYPTLPTPFVRAIEIKAQRFGVSRHQLMSVLGAISIDLTVAILDTMTKPEQIEELKRILVRYREARLENMAEIEPEILERGTEFRPGRPGRKQK